MQAFLYLFIYLFFLSLVSFAADCYKHDKCVHLTCSSDSLVWKALFCFQVWSYSSLENTEDFMQTFAVKEFYR